jgi:hypothetical protein
MEGESFSHEIQEAWDANTCELEERRQVLAGLEERDARLCELTRTGAPPWQEKEARRGTPCDRHDKH